MIVAYFGFKSAFDVMISLDLSFKVMGFTNFSLKVDWKYQFAHISCLKWWFWPIFPWKWIWINDFLKYAVQSKTFY